MSDLNGESLHDWITSEHRIAQREYFISIRHHDDTSRAYYQGKMDLLRILWEKLKTKQVNPYGDRTPVSD